MRAWIRATAWPVSGAPATVDLARRDARCPARWREPASPASARYRARGCLKDGEAAQRNVVAAAVHARRGGLEPCRLCVALRRDERWEVITQQDEDQARRLLRAHRDGPRQHRMPEGCAPEPGAALSNDARFVL